MINEGPYDPNIFKVIFMSGIPGAGKSSVSNAIQQGTGLKIVNYDNIHEYFLKKNVIDHEKFSSLLDKKIQTYISGRLGMIIDKTSQNYRDVIKLKSSLENVGYQCCMIYVNTDLGLAKERVIKRYHKTGRNVDDEYIDYVFKKLTLNLGKFQKDFGENLFIVDNTRQFNKQNIQKKVNKFLNEPLNYIARNWVKKYSYSKQKDIKEVHIQPIKKYSNDKLLDFLNTHCGIALNQWRNGNVIYKGSTNDNYNVNYINPKRIKRKSAHTHNYYTLFVDNVWPKYGFPKRSNSLICSTDYYTSDSYGSVYTVFPIGDPDIGICPTFDFWSSFPKSSKKLFGDKIDADTLLSTLSTLGIIYSVKLSNDNWKDLSNDLQLLSSKIKENPARGNNKYSQKIIDYVVNGKSLENIMYDFFDPLINNFDIKKLSTNEWVKDDNEIWFSSPSIVILSDVVKSIII